MKKIITVAAVLATVVSAQAQLFNNASGRGLFEPLGMGTEVRGAGGFYSVLQAGNTTLGAGGQTVGATVNTLADDFTNSVAWNLTGASVFAYQTNATTAGIAGGNLTIRSGSPTGAIEATGTWTVSTFAPIFRAAATGSDVRHVQQVDFSLSGTLAAGTHWLVWSLFPDPGNTSGPFHPYLTQVGAASPSGSLNARQDIGGAGFNPLFDGANTTAAQDLPFLIHGSAVPEPASMVVIGLGMIGLLARRKRK
jgi:PEP-CTERM motif